MKDKYQAMVLEDPHDPSLRWLRVTYNGYSFSTIRIDSNDEIFQIISALQQSVQSDGALCPVCDFEQKLDEVCEEHGVYKITPRR